jgi:hypothetical protein
MHYIRSRLTTSRIDWLILSGHYTQFRQFCMTVAQDLELPTRISDPVQTLRALPSVHIDELSMASDDLAGRWVLRCRCKIGGTHEITEHPIPCIP